MAFIFLLFPDQSHAYGVTDRSVTKLSDTLTMYTISYEFGFANADLWMPMLTTQKPADKKLSYTTETGKSQAVVLSDAKIDGRMYFVPKGKKSTFTLLVLEEAAPNVRKGVSVTALPHIVQRDNSKKMLRNLFPQELEHYTTNK
jgi:hypothetical protein